MTTASEVLGLLRRRGAWYRESSNPPVRSCAEAARHRHRLGQVGIPLCDELKSLLYSYRHASSGRQYVMLHCRGHQAVDLAKVQRVVGGPVEAVPAAELALLFNAEYGSVTPLVYVDRGDLRHLVEETVLIRFYPPYTMMTNAGDLEHAVEFRATELFAALPETQVVDLVRDEDKIVPRHVLGILTGDPPESGLLLWQKVNERIRADRRISFRPDVGFPRLVVESVPELAVTAEIEDRWADAREAVIAGVERLCVAGVSVVGVASSATQHLARDIESVCHRHGAEFISPAAELGTYLRREGITSFDLLGTDTLKDLGGLSDLGRALRGLDAHLPDPRQVKHLARLARDVKRDVISPAAVNHLRDVLNDATETDVVVLALTELSVLQSRLRKQRSDKRIIDVLDVVADRIAGVYLQERLVTGGA